MGKCRANFEVGPTTAEALACFVCCNVDRVLIDVVELSQRLDEIDSVAFVATELRPDSVSIDCDADRDRIRRIFKMDIQSRQSCQILFVLSLLVLAGRGSLRIDALSARVALTDACRLTA